MLLLLLSEIKSQQRWNRNEGVVDFDSDCDLGFRVSATARFRAFYGSVVNHLWNFKFRPHNVWFSHKFWVKLFSDIKLVIEDSIHVL